VSNSIGKGGQISKVKIKGNEVNEKRGRRGRLESNQARSKDPPAPAGTPWALFALYYRTQHR
jgi:hypothetical protein